MKGISTFSGTKAFAVSLMVLAALLFSGTADSQGRARAVPIGVGITERLELATTQGKDPSEGESQYVTVPPGYKLLMIAPEESVVHVIGGEPEPPGPEFMVGVNVWIEAVFIQMERGISRDFEKSIGFKLSPPDGRALLSAEEKETILAAVEKAEKARIIASLSFLTLPGQQAQVQEMEEVTYPTEYTISGDKVIPGNWEQRDVGAILNVTPTPWEGEEGRLISLVLMPEVTTLCGWKTYDGSELGPPIFTTFNITTTVIVPDGSTFVMKQSPVTSPFVSQAVDPEGATNPENQVTLLLLVSAKLVPYE